MVSILGLAGAAFACDRLFLQSGSEPQAGPAAPSASASHEETKAAAAPAPDAGVDPSAPTLAERLKKVASAPVKKGDDPFAARWRGATSGSARPGAKVEATAQATADGFAKTHALTSVSNIVATISKRAYKVGDDVDGWKLTEVNAKELWAKLELGGSSVTLRLKTLDPKAITQLSPDGNP